MIKLVYGPKGSGKTKRIIASANKEIASAKGNHVYITDNLMHTLDIDRRVRFVNICDYSINKDCGRFISFIEGLIAGDGDITKIYIDGVCAFLGPTDTLEQLFKELEKISDKHKVIFTISVSFDAPPAFLKKYID